MRKPLSIVSKDVRHICLFLLFKKNSILKNVIKYIFIRKNYEKFYMKKNYIFGPYMKTCLQISPDHLLKVFFSSRDQNEIQCVSTKTRI